MCYSVLHNQIIIIMIIIIIIITKIIIITITIIIIIIRRRIPVAYKYSGWDPSENSHVSWEGEVLFILCWQSPRDSVSIKLLVVVQPRNH